MKMTAPVTMRATATCILRVADDPGFTAQPSHGAAGPATVWPKVPSSRPFAVLIRPFAVRIQGRSAGAGAGRSPAHLQRPPDQRHLQRKPAVGGGAQGRRPM